MSALHPAPAYASNEGVIDAVRPALGAALIEAREANFEISLRVARDALCDVLRTLRDQHGYQQLMEIAGVDYPDRAERFEVCYHLLSLTRNHRLRVKVTTDAAHPVPTVTGLWPVAGWLEREVFDMYGVLFADHPDLRRILTDYGFRGHPFRKDFPLTGHIELRWSEEEERVVYEPVELAQDFRSFDFMSPWEGADYVLPGDEKGTVAPAPAPAAAAAVRQTTGVDKPAVGPPAAQPPIAAAAAPSPALGEGEAGSKGSPEVAEPDRNELAIEEASERKAAPRKPRTTAPRTRGTPASTAAKPRAPRTPKPKPGGDA